jgi:hypothetical protein
MRWICAALAVIGSWLAGCEASRDEAPVGPGEITGPQYVQAATDEALARASEIPARRVVSARVGRWDNGYVVVCGSLQVGEETLPFASIWGEDERLDQGRSIVPVRGAQTPSTEPLLAPFVENALRACRRAGLEPPA